MNARLGFRAKRGLARGVGPDDFGPDDFDATERGGPPIGDGLTFTVPAVPLHSSV